MDLLINNYDRVPLPCWTNAGNLSNVIVTPSGRLVGIDQQVFHIEAGPGLDEYLSKVKTLASQVLRGNAFAVTDRIRSAIQHTCGVQLADDSKWHILAGVR